MLTVTLIDDFTKAITSEDFNMGDGDISMDVLIERVFSVEADGPELEKIYKDFGNLPKSNFYGRAITWYGDHAKFIVGNLKL